MLQIIVPAQEMWDEKNERIVAVKEQKLQLEHSLVSISKWESKWHKPFLSNKEMSMEESLDYYRCMTITQNVNPLVYACLTSKNYAEINSYISDSYSATTFRDKPKPGRGREIITSELVYYWMISYGIPFKCETWNFNRLMTLIRICEIKNRPPKKRSQRDIISSYAAENAARRKMWNTTG